MASATSPMECSICLEAYNDTTRRPRTLSCGHNFCSPCILNCIVHGGKSCSVCRKAHSASRVDDFPINTDLEKISHMWSLVVGNMTRNNVLSDDEDEFSNGRCSNHRLSFLYFKCETHGVYICRDCTVLDHSPQNCNIIDVKKEIMKTKEQKLKEAQQHLQRLDSVTSTLNTIILEKTESIASKKAQIIEDNKVRDQAQKEVSDNMSASIQLQECIQKLQKATSKNKINKEISELENKCEALIKNIDKLEEKYGSEDFIELLFKDIKCAAKLMEERCIQMFAINDNNDESTKVQPVDGSLHLSSMEKNVKQTHNAMLIPVSSLLPLAGLQPIVYLDLQAAGKSLGRVRIMLTCGPKRREQMIRLCTGYGGNTWKGSDFGAAWVGQAGEYIYCHRGYIKPDGTNSKALTVQDVEQDMCKWRVEGVVCGYSNDTDFNICTITDPTNTATLPNLGRLVSGLDILRQALRQYGYNGSDPTKIKIVDAGVEITPS